ncbi:MAG: TetR/AcrR family transcriptional regulator [Candidatus Omnitrophica bacterium]|nr:TetR/AcrR family transcriptional regulator [Candidatus Omnitrophota bacterium]
MDTREKIAYAATHLFAVHGYDATSIRDIAEKAGVTKPVVYYYFQSKENLFATLIHEAYDFFFQALEKLFEEETDFWDRWKKVTRLYFDLSMQYRDTVQLIYIYSFGPRGKSPRINMLEIENIHTQFLARLFREGMQQGLVRNIENIEWITNLYLGVIVIYQQQLLFTDVPIPENYSDIIMEMVYNGIGGAK